MSNYNPRNTPHGTSDQNDDPQYTYQYLKLMRIGSRLHMSASPSAVGASLKRREVREQRAGRPAQDGLPLASVEIGTGHVTHALSERAAERVIRPKHDPVRTD